MEICNTFPAAQSAEQAYTRNVHQDGKCYKKNINKGF